MKNFFFSCTLITKLVLYQSKSAAEIRTRDLWVASSTLIDEATLSPENLLTLEAFSTVFTKILENTKIGKFFAFFFCLSVLELYQSQKIYLKK